MQRRSHIASAEQLRERLLHEQSKRSPHERDGNARARLYARSTEIATWVSKCEAERDTYTRRQRLQAAFDFHQLALELHEEVLVLRELSTGRARGDRP